MGYIRTQDLVVEFPIYNNAHRSLKRSVLRAATGGRLANGAGNQLVVRAIDGISVEIRSGDRVALTGHNGSGKTTLLRVLAGAYEPVGGQVEIVGRVASLLDVSLGLDPDATGYENIFLRGLMMGLTKAELREKTAEIAEFAGLGDFLGLPMRAYSSGMQMRLAFAISTSVQADILLMDEWLSVGDAEFREKAAQRLDALVKNASILVFASHSPELVAKVCNRALRIEHGKIVEDLSFRDTAPPMVG